MGPLKKNLPKYLLWFVLILLIGALFGRRLFRLDGKKQPWPATSGLVTAVYDGDTIKVKFADGHSCKVRLIGVDAPELSALNLSKRFKAFMSKRFAFSNLYRREVKLAFDRELKDSYGRILAYVWTEEVGLFNLYIIREGFASALLYFPFREDYRQQFQAAEKAARRDKKGIWHQIPYPRIKADQLAGYIGKIVTVVFNCHRLNRKRKLLFLAPSDRKLSAVIPLEYISAFPSIDNFLGKTLAVTGLLEQYKSQFQIFVFLPPQIKLEN